LLEREVTGERGAMRCNEMTRIYGNRCREMVGWSGITTVNYVE
jgi:hypothetical protein